MSMQITKLIAIIVTAFISTLTCAESAWENLDFITEEYPPYNYTESGIARGITVDILLESAALVALPLERRNIRSMPWARGYQMAQKGPGVMLFSMTRTNDREHLFKWVGPIVPSRIVLLAHRDQQFKLTAPGDLSAYKIGVIRDDIGHQLLNQLGIENKDLQISSSAVGLANMLERGRIDFWAYDEITAIWFIKKLGLDSTRFGAAYTLKDGEMYYAFSLDTDDTQISALQQGLDKLKQQQRYLDIVNAYK